MRACHFVSLVVALFGAACSSKPPTAADAGITSLPTLRVRAFDSESRAPVACKVTVRGEDGTRTPTWRGAGSDDHVGLAFEGGVLVGHVGVSVSCAPIALPLAAGRYAITVSAGPERALFEARVTVAADGASLDAPLARAVDSSGWACGDLHVHSAPSFDSDVPLDQRLIAAAAEGLDLVAPTDHDASTRDWTPALTETGAQLRVMLGDELSPGVDGDDELKGHFNVYPIPDTLRLPDELPHRGLSVPQIVERVRRVLPDALIQVNHPRSDASFGYFNLVDLDPVTGEGGGGIALPEFDTLEVWNAHDLDLAPNDTPIDVILDDWYALLRAGRGVVAVGNSDTHRLARTPVGYPRTCVRVARDAPGSLTEVDFVEGLRVGNAFVTSGPFVDLVVGGEGLGALVVPAPGGAIDVMAHVQAAPWVSVTRVRVVVDGETAMTLPVAELPGTVRASLVVRRDAFVLVVVEGDAPLGVAAGEHAGAMRSLAFTNPVFIDADGDGRWTAPR